MSGSKEMAGRDGTGDLVLPPTRVVARLLATRLAEVQVHGCLQLYRSGRVHVGDGFGAYQFQRVFPWME